MAAAAATENRAQRFDQLDFIKSLIEDGEANRFDTIRAAVEDVVGGYYRGVIPMAGVFAEGRALPIKTSRTPVKTLSSKLLPGWYVLYGAHPDGSRSLDSDDEADVKDLAACKWRTASGNQCGDRYFFGVTKKYYDADETHLFGGRYRVRGTIFSRIEDDAQQAWVAGRPMVSICVVSRREIRMAATKEAKKRGVPDASEDPLGYLAASARDGAARAAAPAAPPPSAAAAAYAPEAYAPPPPPPGGGGGGGAPGFADGPPPAPGGGAPFFSAGQGGDL